ncbi:MAG: hypothetical protein ABII13_05355 [Patescibacteria group bacterium]|nr:hypothetical protein [Patescibacteria group bacterium]MBU2508794.1 hypothetical protein [Patescibacteria group bacterium]
MTKTKKQALKIFLVGFIFGMLFWSMLIYIDEFNSFQNKVIELLFQIFFPFVILRPLGSIFYFFLDPLCNVFKAIDFRIGGVEACAGLALDGGPLAWLEYLWIWLVVGVFYGVIFLTTFKIISWIKRKFRFNYKS